MPLCMPLGYTARKSKVAHWCNASRSDRRYELRMTEHRHFFLKEWREYRGMTQQQLADAADLTKGYVSNLERGQKRYNEDTLEVFAKVLRCEPWELIGRNPLADDERQGAEIVDIWDRIPVGQKQTAARVLKSFADSDEA